MENYNGFFFRKPCNIVSFVHRLKQIPVEFYALSVSLVSITFQFHGMIRAVDFFCSVFFRFVSNSSMNISKTELLSKYYLGLVVKLLEWAGFLKRAK